MAATDASATTATAATDTATDPSAAQQRNRISIIGVGRLGLCTALVLDEAGFEVLGCDIFPAYVEQLNARTFRSPEPGVDELLRAAKQFRATTSLDEAVAWSDLLLVLVDTPTGSGDKSYDHSKLSRVLYQLNERRVRDKHISIGCTVLPGYIAGTARYLVRDCANTTVNYNPEFIAQGDILRGFRSPDMVLIGQQTEAAGDRLAELYARACRNRPAVHRMSAESAEITKLAVNCFITTKISFANMVGDIADATPSADKLQILAAVGADLRVGSKCLLPGYGFGGPCFPRDNRALGNYATSIGVDAKIARATDDFNHYHADVLVERFLADGRDSYTFDDVAYKERCPVPIIEESHKLIVAAKIARRGKKVTIRDRAIIIAEVQKEYGSLFSYEVLDA